MYLMLFRSLFNLIIEPYLFKMKIDIETNDVIARTIVAYKASFLDEIVDRFIEIWEK